MRRVSPAAVAAILTLAALGLPCVAWYVTGSRATREEAQRLRRAPRLQAQLEARRIAERIGSRLEALRLSETRRSFLDYRSADESLAGAACEARLASPLAQGPPDPMVWAHFQIDELGQLALPSMGVGDGSDVARAALRSRQAILETLECAAHEQLSTLLAVDDGQAQPVRGLGRDWVVTVGPFRWHTIDLDGQPALVAVRGVRLPNATLSQGFAVRPDALEVFVRDSALPAALRPGKPESPLEAMIQLAGTEWTVAVDESAAAAAAAAQARQIVAGFRRSFAGGLAAALFAGALVVVMVWQSDRLARQRAGFAAAAAHELRTPLAGLRMYGEMLADDRVEQARRQLYGRRVAGEAERLGRVVSNLLGFSRLERGELTFDSTSEELAAALRTSIEQLRPLLEAGGARIELEIDSDLPPIRFNRDALHQIVQNLLDNAEKYGRSAKDRTIRIELVRCSEGARLSVVDRGPGVDPSVRRSLFRPFVRNPAPEAPSGLGLGLALVQALARAQGASAAYADAAGGGSRFSVTFRAAA